MSDSPHPSLPDPLVRLAERARAYDGQPPFSDQSLVDLSTGARHLLWAGDYAAALVSDAEAEFVVDPDARRRGFGTALLERLLSGSGGELLVWAHGDHPGARALARSHGGEAVRELLQLRAELAASDRTLGTPWTDRPAGTGISAFRPGLDDDEWLALNARAFAGHPEQGRVTAEDLRTLTAEPWFDADDFLLLRDSDADGDGNRAHAAGELIGYAWLKVEDDIGEFYVVGVAPERQGTGIGRRLVEAGLARLAARGIRTAHLYVEADNAPALRLYRAYGFGQHSIDIQYRFIRR